eukprot:jgi/Psemu1/183093/e_gw1.29.107.1
MPGPSTSLSSYPATAPANKHDLLCIRGASNSSSPSAALFSSSSELFRKVISYDDKDFAKNGKPESKAFIYSYNDGPEYPGPLSRSLLVLGYADRSLSTVRKLIDAENDEDGVACDGLHSCTIAVQLADEPKRFDRMEKRHQVNSIAFAKYVKKLRERRQVAVLAKDKYDRFGILAPFEQQQKENEKTGFGPNDFAAKVYIGDVREVMNFLAASSSGGRNSSSNNNNNNNNNNSDGWKPTTPPLPPASSSDPSMPWASSTTNNNDAFSDNKRSYDDMNDGNGSDEEEANESNGNKFHSDTGAAAADAFYSGLTRDQKTRDKSILYHMKCFNNWVKATQIAELDPNTGTHKQPLRVLDLACGKGGDLTKWTIHKRGMRNYVGIDVARGSLKDAAQRARGLRKKNKLTKAVFSCADLGSDVPGRMRSSRSKGLQKLLTWSLENEAPFESGDPEFRMVAGGGISPSDSFDIVSIQFAIHYMMQTGKRARRFFHTVSQLLDIGGNLAFTTIDARVVVDHMMNLGHNFHFEDGNELDFPEVVVEAGGGACRLKFEPHIVQKLLQCRADGTKGEEDLFGLEYTFTLVEGDDHAAGMGDAVNLPEWLIPIPVLVALGKEAGLELEYAHNFHEFYQARNDPSTHHAAHMLLSNMKVPNSHGSISDDEWSIIRLYLAVRFRKVRESSIVIDEEIDGDGQSDEDDDEEEAEEATAPKIELDAIKAKKMYPMAMMKAKRNAGDQWNSFSREEKEELTQIELQKLAAK